MRSREAIDGVAVFVWCEAEKIKMTVLGSEDSGYTIIEEDAARAGALEPRIGTLADRLVDPPEDTNHYVCPQYYPEWFAE